MNAREGRKIEPAAAALGLDAAIGGHDQLVVLCLLAHAYEETGRSYPLADLAECSGLDAGDLLEGPIGGLVAAGYAEVEPGLPQPAEPFGAYRVSKDAEPVVTITRSGAAALEHHLAALHALPHSLQDHMLGRSGPAPPTAGGPA